MYIIVGLPSQAQVFVSFPQWYSIQVHSIRSLIWNALSYYTYVARYLTHIISQINSFDKNRALPASYSTKKVSIRNIM